MMFDPDSKPMSKVNPELHSDFSEPHELFVTCVSPNMTVEHIKDKRTDSRVKGIKMVEMFKVSGNGDGNCVNTEEEWVERTIGDDNFGHFDHSLYKDDKRKNFLGNNGTEILYYWDSKDWIGQLKLVFASLSKDQTGTSERVAQTETPSSTQTRKQRNRNDDDDDDEQNQLVSSINCMVEADGVWAVAESYMAVADRNRTAADAERARTTGIADITRAWTSGLANLTTLQIQNEDAITRYTLLSFDAIDERRKALYLSMAAKAQHRNDILAAEMEMLSAPSITTNTNKNKNKNTNTNTSTWYTL